LRTSREVSAEKLRGGFYTPGDLVRRCLDRVAALTAGRSGLTVLEPSAGDGAFLRGLACHPLSGRVAQLTAIEPSAADAARCRDAAAGTPFQVSVVTGSALAAECRPAAAFDVAIGNPPFVRFQFVGPGDAAAAEVLARELGVPLAGVANLWLPVLLAALSTLRPGGAFAFVVPAELFTGVSAGTARAWLAGYSGRLRIDLFAPGSFPGVLQEVVIISGTRRPPAGRAGPRLELHEHDQAGESRWQHALASDSRSWTGYLLRPDLLGALTEAGELAQMRRLGELARFEVATVTGANAFFTVDDATLGAYRLSPWALPLLPRARHAPGLIFTAADHAALRAAGGRAHLLDFSAKRPPPAGPLPLAYLGEGQRAGLAGRYKCRIRRPWYRVPVVPPGQLMLSKRSHRYPRLVLNEAAAHTTDTIYRGRLLPGVDSGTAARLVTAFHNSLTLLTAETEGRSFGGGVLELVPAEVSRLLVPAGPPAGAGHLPAGELARLDKLARACAPGDGEALVAETDRLLAAHHAGLPPDLLARLQEARWQLLERRLRRGSKPGGRPAGDGGVMVSDG
jgi:adenine-specific DNA-methyltransferase